MKRLVFPAIIAALSICHNASAQSPSRIYTTRIPNTQLIAAEKNESVLNEKMNSSVGGGYYQGADYGGFGANNCGCQTGPGCCDGAWDGYTRGCGLRRLFHKHHGICCAPVGCGGCGGGGCFGHSFAGG